MAKKWEDMTPAERQEERFDKWLNPPIEFVSPEAKRNYQARITRCKDALQLKKTPDRVPVFPFYTFMPVTLYGSTPKEVMYDPAKMVSIWQRYLDDYQPDYFISPGLVMNGPVLEKMDYKLYKWPGHGVSDTSPYQCLEKEYMKPEEYQALIQDPSDFWMRTYMPRVFGALAPFQNYLPLPGLMELPLVGPYMVPLGTPEFQKSLQTLMEAGKLALEWGMHIGGFEMEAARKGFVNGAGGISKAPFDVIGDTLRGTHGIFMDMYRHKDLLLEALERLTPILTQFGVAGATGSGNPMVFMPLHKGADGFLSDEQFRVFYWPTLKKVILGLVEQGCVPYLFAEGGYNSRLECLNELPKGTTIWMFDRTDMGKAKQAIGEKICIAGNVPVTKILTGTPEQVKGVCRELIDVAGKGGGYIMTCGCSMDQAKPDTLHAMIDFTKEYGVYK